MKATSVPSACSVWQMRRRIFPTVILAAGAVLVGIPSASFDAASGALPASSTGQPLASATGDPVFVAVGDMACDPASPAFSNGAGTSSACAELRTSNLVVADGSVDGVLGLGDYQYDCGDPSDYAVSYNPTWGRLDNIFKPVVGNHEYKTGLDVFGGTCPTTNTTAQSYFGHFGAAAHPDTKGHFSFDVGSWHLIALNGNCSKSGVGGCSATSAQTTWLKSDLASTSQPCIGAFWHQPLFTASSTVNGAAYRPWWDALYAAHADLVLNGHQHNYQRYAALTPSGTPDQANGITQYVVGTGGEALGNVNTSVTPTPVAWRRTFGYLRLTLHPTGWDSQFIDSTGAVLDSANGSCHR